MEQIIEALKTAVPGLLGATSTAVVITKEISIKRRIGMILMSSSFAYYSYEYFAEITGMPQGMSSFVMGLFAAPVIETFVRQIPQITIGETFMDWVRKRLGLTSHKESEHK